MENNDQKAPHKNPDVQSKSSKKKKEEENDYLENFFTFENHQDSDVEFDSNTGTMPNFQVKEEPKENESEVDESIEYDLPYGWRKICHPKPGTDKWYYYVYAPDGTM